MANNYLQFSLTVPLLSQNEKSWCSRTLTAFVALLNDEYEFEPAEEPEAGRARLASSLGDLGRRVIDEELSFSGFDWSFIPPDKGDADGAGKLWLYAEEAGEPEQVAAFLEHFLATFKRADVITFTWATTCSKMRVGEFGGGAAVVRSTGSTFMEAASWAADLAAAT